MYDVGNGIEPVKNISAIRGSLETFGWLLINAGKLENWCENDCVCTLKINKTDNCKKTKFSNKLSSFVTTYSASCDCDLWPRSDPSKTSTKNYFKCKLENLLNPTRLKIMPLPRLQIYLLPRVTSTFDFLTTKVGISHTCPMDHLWQLSPKSVYLFSKSCIQNLVTNKRPNIWTNGEVENIVPPPARQVLAWRTHNIINSFIYYNCKLSHDNTVL